jgi:hypothetical protein
VTYPSLLRSTIVFAWLKKIWKVYLSVLFTFTCGLIPTLSSALIFICRSIFTIPTSVPTRSKPGLSRPGNQNHWISSPSLSMTLFRWSDVAVLDIQCGGDHDRIIHNPLSLLSSFDTGRPCSSALFRSPTTSASCSESPCTLCNSQPLFLIYAFHELCPRLYVHGSSIVSHW